MSPLCYMCETQHPDMCKECMSIFDPELNYGLADEEEFNFGEQRTNISSGEDAFA